MFSPESGGPKSFEEVIGQGHAVTTIQNAIASNRVAHAYLFSGPRGVGKTTLARIMAKALNCVEGPTPEPCQKCAQCLDITRGSSLDVYEIDGASNRGIDEIRELKDNVQYLPSSGRYKIYIIDEVHMLTKEAFNALLKTLEEPPEHALFIFATTEAHRVPVTILSRCQRFDFRRVSSADLFEHLKKIAERESIPAEPKALMAIAREADGGVRDALSLMDQTLSYSPERLTYQTVMEVLGFIDRGTVLKLLERLVAGDMAAVMEIVEQLHMGGHDLKQFYKSLLEEVRNLLALRISPAVVPGLSEEPEEREARQRLLSSTSTHWLMSALHQLLALDTELRYGSYPKFVLELGLFKLAHLREFLSVDDLLEGLENSAPETSGVRDLQAGFNGGVPMARSADKRPAAPAAEEKKPEPLLAPETPADLPVEENRDCDSFLRNLEQEAIVLAAILKKAKMSLDNDGLLEVRFPPDVNGLKLLDEDQLRATASAYFQRPVRLHIIREEGAASSPIISAEERIEIARTARKTALEHPVVRQVSDIFGARLLEVRPLKENSDDKETING